MPFFELYQLMHFPGMSRGCFHSENQFTFGLTKWYLSTKGGLNIFLHHLNPPKRISFQKKIGQTPWVGLTTVALRHPANSLGFSTPRFALPLSRCSSPRRTLSGNVVSQPECCNQSHGGSYYSELWEHSGISGIQVLQIPFMRNK